MEKVRIAPKCINYESGRAHIVNNKKKKAVVARIIAHHDFCYQITQRTGNYLFSCQMA